MFLKRMIRKYVKKGLAKYSIMALIASLISIILGFLAPQIIRFTIDFVLTKAEITGEIQYLAPIVEFAQGNLYSVALLVIICSLLGGAFLCLSRASMAKFAEGTVKHLRDMLFYHIQHLPFSWHTKNQTGDILQRCTSDVNVIREFLNSQLIEVVRIAFIATIALALMFSMNVRLATIALVFIPIVFAYSTFFFQIIARHFRLADEAEGATSVAAQENFTAVRVVRAFGRQKFEMDNFREKNHNFAYMWTRLGYYMGFYWGIGDFVVGTQNLLILIFGCVEAVNGNLTLGELLTFIVYNHMLAWPIRGLGQILAEASKMSVSLERISEILNAAPEEDAGDLCPNLRGDIEFRDVSFGYLEGQGVLENISFTIKQGSNFAILGSTASGKSTLIHLLNRLYTLEKGEIIIGGVNINDINISHLRRNIGMVLQEPFLFSKTIKENITVQQPSTTLEETRHFARIAAVDTSIMDFTMGYDTLVGERGVTLSGGQKQRVAIARMLISRPPIMVFDDSLSAVDMETDLRIRTALKENTGESTVILIANRVSSVMHCDNIMVLENGKITQLGTHEQLIEQEGLYSSLYHLQAGESA